MKKKRSSNAATQNIFLLIITSCIHNYLNNKGMHFESLPPFCKPARNEQWMKARDLIAGALEKAHCSLQTRVTCCPTGKQLTTAQPPHLNSRNPKCRTAERLSTSKNGFKIKTISNLSTVEHKTQTFKKMHIQYMMLKPHRKLRDFQLNLSSHSHFHREDYCVFLEY